MALNLTHYEKVYQNKFKEALKKSRDLIDALVGRPPDMPLDYITAITIKNIDAPKPYYDEVCRFIGSMMFSSGYWHSYKIRTLRDGLLSVRHEISIMTDAQKQDHLWDEHEKLEDPRTWGESDEDESSDDETTAKSETATPHLG